MSDDPAAIAPALIDPPSPFASLAEWQEYRDELDRLDLPHLAPFKRHADRMIEQLSSDPQITE